MTQMFKVYYDKIDKTLRFYFPGYQAERGFETNPYFGGWLTDWISYEVEEEE